MQQLPQQTTTVITVPAQQQQPVQYVVPVRAPGQHVYPKFPQKQALAAGILLIVAALLSIIFNIVELAVSYSGQSSSDTAIAWVFGNVGHGFWVGVMCILPGGLGIGASKRKTKCLINAFNVMCIIGASFAACQFAIALPGAIVGPRCYVYRYYYYYSSYSYGYYAYENCPPFQATDVAMEALLTALALVEAAAAIWGSAICCRTTCCCSCCLAEPRPPTTVAQPYGTQLMVISSNQQMQPVMVQGYPNVAYQPGYPGQPTQFTSMTPMYYPSQDQFIAAAAPSPPQYPATYDNVPYGAQPVNEPKFSNQAGADPAAST